MTISLNYSLFLRPAGSACWFYYLLLLQSSVFAIKIMCLNMINRTERFSNSFILGNFGSGFELKDCVLMFSYLVRSTKMKELGH